MSIEAMKQALEALESATPKYTRQRADQKTLGGALDYWKLEQHQRLKAITSLRQAIAEAEKQEPHSWYSAQEDEWMTNKIRKEHERLNSYTHKVGKFDLALYTHPQPKREPVACVIDGKLMAYKNGPLPDNCLLYDQAL